MAAAVHGKKNVTQQQAWFALRPIACGVMLACCGGAWANPTGPQVMHGAAQIQGMGSSHLKVTNTPGSIIHWQGFSIGAGQVTQFIQQSASSSVLNRVVGADISQIHGQLLSNGRVFLINPAGILIGAGAVIDTAGFVGSTLNMLDGDFLAGKLKFQGGGGAGSIVNQGWIKAGQGGNIVLVAPNIENSGIIQTEGGEIVLAAGHKMTIGSIDLEGVQFEIQAPEDAVLNVGKLLADGGAVGVFSGTLKHTGDIRANALVRDQAGRIVLKGKQDVTLTAGSTVKADGKTGGAVTVQSTSGTTILSGAISAQGSEGKGGDVRVLGERVGVFDAASVDVSGSAGGGQILVGGDYLGRNPEVQNAWRTFVAPDATLRADAGHAGDGGKIIVWSDDTTRFNGTISASGGANSGDGGFIETSGKHALMVGASARVDARAPAGARGSWLLDPDDIDVNSPSATPVAAADQFADPGNVTIAAATINAAGADVTLQANNDISIFENITLTAGRSLTMQAGASITFDDSIITTNNGNVTLIANETTANGVIAANRGAGPAQIFMNNPSGINAQGSGSVVARINTGAGHAGNSGNITLSNVTGQNVTVENLGPTAGSSIVRAAAGSLITSTASTTLSGAAIGAAAAPMRLAPGAGTVSATSTGAGVNDGVFIQHPVGSGDIVLSRYALSAVAGTAVTLTTGNDQITVDASLNLPGVNVTLNPSGTAESVVFSAASTINANLLTLGGTRFTDFNSGAGAVNLNTPVTMNQQVQINGGTVSFNGASAITAGLEPRLTLAGGTLAGTALLTVNGNALWSGGGMAGAGTTAVTGALTMNGANKSFLGRTLTVGGATTWTAGNVLADGGGFTNTGALNIQGDVLWTQNTPGAAVTTFTNTGGITRSVTGGLAALDRAVVNGGGAINVQTGSLRLSGNGVADGTAANPTGLITVTGGATLLFGGGTYTLPNNVIGAGNVDITGGVFNLNGNYTAGPLRVLSATSATFANPMAPASLEVSGSTVTLTGNTTIAGALTFSSGTLTGGGNVTANGVFNWSGGTLAGTGAFTTANAANNLTGAVTLDGRTWTNNGTVNQTGAGRLTFANNGIVNNTAAGTWTLSGTAATPMTGAGTFNNAGLFDNNAAAAHTVSPTTFNNTGVAPTNGLTVTNGTLTISAVGNHSGEFDVANGATLDFAGGNDTFSGTLQGAGTIRFSGGANNTLQGAAVVNGLGSLTVAGVGVGVTVDAGAGAFTNSGLAVTDGALTLNRGGATPTTVAVSGGTADFNAAVTVGTATFSGGTATFDAAGSTVTGVTTINGGTVGGTGELFANGGLAFTSGTIASPVATPLTVTGSTTVSGAGSPQITGGLATDALTMSGANLAITGTGELVITGAGGGTVSGGTLTNAGLVGLTAAGTLTFSGTGALTNSGRLDPNVAGSQFVYGGGPHAFNAGTLFQGGAGRHVINGNSTFNVASVDNLTINGGILGGTTQFAGTTAWTGGTFAGTFTVAAGGNLSWSGGQLTGLLDVLGTGILNVPAGGTPVVMGAGAVLTNGGTTNVLGTLALTGGGSLVNNATLNWIGGAGGGIAIGAGSTLTNGAGGTASLKGTASNTGITGAGTFVNNNVVDSDATGLIMLIGSDFTNGGTTNINAGVLQLTVGGNHAGTFAVDAGTTLEFGGGTHTITAAGQVAVAGNLEVSGGLLVHQGILNLMPTGAMTITNSTVNNDGAVNYNTGGDNLLVANAGVFNNTAAGVFDIKADLRARGAGSGMFNNAGTFLKSGGTPGGSGGTDATLPFTNNGGVLNAQMGTLQFGGVSAFNNGTQFIGVGNNVVSGNSTFNGTITSNGLTLQGGNFSGTANLAGTTTWTGGTMTGAFTIPTGSVLNLTGAASKGITGNTLANAGTLALAGTGNLVLSGGGVSNTGTLDIQSDADITQIAASTLSNTGTLKKSGGNGTSAIGGPGFTMTSTGAMRVLSGTLEVNGLATNAGALTIDAGTTFSTAGNALMNTGTLKGNGVLALAGQAFTNAALVAPGASPGTLVIDGNFIQTAAGTLAIDLGGTNQGTTYDFLQITGTAVLDGILAVTNVNGFVPAAGNRFEFMSYGSHTGDFATFNFPPGTQMQASPGALIYAVSSPSGFGGAGMGSEQMSETRRLYDHFLEIIPEDAVEEPPRVALICD